MEHPKLRLTIPWASLESEAQQQIARTLALPQLECLAIMPDVHAGYDLCIGGVALLRGVVSPSFVGYDIGCGMCHVNTGCDVNELGLARPKDREKLFRRLQEAVPAGLGKAAHTASDMVFRSASEDKKLDKQVEPFIYKQLGTLGSGNHFLEVGVNAAEQVGIIPANQRDGVWVTRGLGNATFLCSASHGAGRKLSRKAAARKGTPAELARLMKGIVCRKDKDVLDEAPWAYKNIDAVLAAQDGILVDVIDHFKPLIVVKG